MGARGVNHVSIHADDIDESVRFYEELFGWTTQEFPIGPVESYAIVRQSGRDVGGIYNLRAKLVTVTLPSGGPMKK